MSFLTHLDLSFMEAVMLCVIVFVAAIIRGFAGFGFGAITLAAGSLFIAPVQLVPISLTLEIFASLHMLPGIWRPAHWKAIGWIFGTSVLTVPVAQYLLGVLPIETTRLIVAVLIIVMSIILLCGFTISAKRKLPLFIGSGLISGAINGIAAIGGIVVTLAMFSVAAAPSVVRATTAMYLLIADVYAIGISYALGNGLFNPTVWARVALVLPFLFAGVWVGSRQFAVTDETTWRRIALGIPIVMSVIGLIRAGWYLVMEP